LGEELPWNRSEKRREKWKYKERRKKCKTMKKYKERRKIG
jgi:hypothetical protein